MQKLKNIKKYMVLNELNNLKIRNVRVDVETKQRIYKDLFEKQKNQFCH